MGLLSLGCMPENKNQEQEKSSFGCMPPLFYCHKNRPNSQHSLPYSRGGAGGTSSSCEEERLIIQEDQIQLMYTTAISMACTFNCDLKPGVATRGLGECLIEACIDQFIRCDFEELTEEEKEPMYWRTRLADLMENNITAYTMYRIDKNKGKGDRKSAVGMLLG